MCQAWWGHLLSSYQGTGLEGHCSDTLSLSARKGRTEVRGYTLGIPTPDVWLLSSLSY